MEPLPEALVGTLLRARGLKLVLAESCTGGLAGHRITNVAGSSDYYLGSITAYAYEAKQRLLGVHAETLLQHGAVSRATVLEMAHGARAALAADFGMDSIVAVSISGVAGPGGGTPTKPVGTVWIGLSSASGEWAWRYRFQGDRIQVKEQSAQEALCRLKDYLLEQLPAEEG